MTPDNMLLALTLLDSLLTRAVTLNATIQTARKEGRDISDAELAGAQARDDTARLTLEAAIAKAKSEGR